MSVRSFNYLVTAAFGAMLLALLGGCANQSSAPSLTETVVNKSPNDSREYRYTMLDNGLQVLLIADAKADKSAASLTVFRGSMHEPADYPGLAHFLEHMLFIGTEKYPEVDGYQQFLSANGGSSNAYTAGDHTNYFFDVAPAQLPEALDRFAQFFISPSLSPDYVEREKNAVHSEYQLQLKEDGWRQNAVERLALNPEHPGARFNIGSLDTLGEGVGAALASFFNQHYSANQMALVVLADRTLDDLEHLVRERFSPIENRQADDGAITARAFATNQLPATLAFKPLKELRTVTYRFPVPSVRALYRSKPEIYITNLLGHEGSGSLFQALKRKGWVTELFAGTGHIDADESTIDVTMALTEEGVENLPGISAYLFHYLDLLRSEAPLEWRYDEQATVAQLGFQFLESRSPTATVYLLSPAFQYLPPAEVLRASFLMEQFDREQIESYLGYLTPDNVLMIVQHKDVDTNKEEPWFGVPYALTPGAIQVAELPEAEATDLALPAANPFLPEDLELLASQPGPNNVVDTESARLWVHTDTEFGSPKSNLRLQLQVPEGITSPEAIAAAQLYQQLVIDALNEFAYATLLAGMNYNVTAGPKGFTISVGGYSDKQGELLSEVLAVLAKLEIDPARFVVLKEKLLDDLANAKQARPFNRAMSALTQALSEPRWPEETIADALAELEVEQLQAWRTTALAEVHLVGLAHGNVDAERAKALVEVVASHFDLTDATPDDSRIVSVNNAATIELDTEHDDAAMVLYVQDREASWAARARTALALQLLRQRYFSDLRTDQQLGYVVAMTSRIVHKRGGTVFVVQSPVAGINQLLAATDEFLTAQPEFVANLSASEFEAVKQGLLVQLLEADKNLNERSGRYWVDLQNDVLTFDSRQQIAALVDELTQEDMLESVRRLVSDSQTRALLVYSKGQFDPAAERTSRYGSVAEFKLAARDDMAATSATTAPHSAE